MRISEAKQCIKQIALHTESVTALVSERGVGKTSAFRQCADELGIGYLGLYAAALEGPDFMGLPDKDREKGITRYLAPQFLPTAQAIGEGLFPERGLLVLEEINRIPSDTVSVLYPLLLDRRINQHALAPGWRIGVTMNPDTMNYAVSSLDDAMIDRFVTITVDAHLGDYLAWSAENGPNGDVLDFLSAFPDMLLVVRKAADSTAVSKAPTPRGWTKVQELLNGCDLPDPLLLELVSGIVGTEAAAAFFGHRRQNGWKLPAAADILTGRASAAPAIASLKAAGRLDLLTRLVQDVLDAWKGAPAQLAAADAFCMDLPDEWRILFFRKLSALLGERFAETAGAMASLECVADSL